MARGLPTTGTIKLTDIMRAFNYSTSNVISTNTYTTPGYNQSSAIAPAGSAWVQVELWGAGGGGRGTNGIGSEYGGGGGGYVKFFYPVVPSSSAFLFDVGSGGNGGASGANGSTGIYSGCDLQNGHDPIYAYGGGGGTTNSSGGQGGTYSNTNIISSFSGTYTQGGNGTTSGGGAGANGGAGGSGSTGAAGTAPGGGGAPNTAGTGGAGAAGQVKFTWLGLNFTAGNTLRSFLAGGSYVKPGAAGDGGNIPASGTITARRFLSAEELGLYANAPLDMIATDTAVESLAEANCVCNVAGIGIFGSIVNTELNFNWMRRLLGNDSSTITQYFDVLLNRVSQTGDDVTLYGNAANTWYQCGSTDQKWWIKASRSTIGQDTTTLTGYLAFRRRSDNVVVANVAFTMTAEADVNPAPDTK